MSGRARAEITRSVDADSVAALDGALRRELEQMRLLTLEEVAAVLRVDVKTVRDRIAQGLLPFVQEGRFTRVTQGALRDYIAERTVGAA